MNKDKPLMVKDLPTGERPREKLLSAGANNLSNAELLAILLRTGTKEDSVLRVAEKLLTQQKMYNGVCSLVNLSPQEMSKVKGIGIVKAVTICAALELGKRMLQQTVENEKIINSPATLAEFLMPRLRFEQKEQFMVVLLNMKNHIIANPVISVGSLNSAIVDAREIFKVAINYSAAALIMVHNHPSGDPTPSTEDINVTNKIAEAGNILDIKVLDHLIIGNDKYNEDGTSTGIYEMNLLGKIYNEYLLSDSYYGYNTIYDNDILVLSDKILRIDSQTGEVIDELFDNDNYDYDDASRRSKYPIQ